MARDVEADDGGNGKSKGKRTREMEAEVPSIVLGQVCD